MKTCSKCLVAKDLGEFSTNKRVKDGRKAQCKACMAEYSRDYLKLHPPTNEQKAAKRERYLQKTYGVSAEWVGARLCGICDSPSGERNHHVDHDHECCLGEKSCGKCVRGVLCYPCNAGLGYFQDSTVLLQRAINYLKYGPIASGWSSDDS